MRTGLALTAGLLLATSAVAQTRGSTRRSTTPTDLSTRPAHVTGSIAVDVRILVSPGAPREDQAVVWLPDLSSNGDANLTRSLTARTGSIQPNIAVIRENGRIRFTSDDASAAHRLFSRSGAHRLDLDLAKKGDSSRLRFRQPGSFEVHCDDHPGEEAHVLVTKGLIAGKTEGSETLFIDEVPPGKHVIKAWHAKSGHRSELVTVTAGETSSVTIDLDATAWSRRQHLNRAGKPYPPPPGSLRVEVSKIKEGKSSPATGAVVWLAGSPAPRRPGFRPGDAGALEVTAKGKRFLPRVLSATATSTVSFPNQDRVFHNVFSLSETKTFDLGLYRNGASKDVNFDKAGVVKVYCNIHPRMVAYVVVIDGDNHGTIDESGAITLDGIPPGVWQLEIWDEDGGETTRTIEIRSGKQTSSLIELHVAGQRDISHSNKHGEEYPDPDDEDSRY